MKTILASLPLRSAVLCGWLGVLSTNAQGSIPPAYHAVADAYQIPVEVFFAVMLQESGKQSRNQFLPWPWVLNVNRKSYYFESQAQAEIALNQFLAVDPAAQIDVGLGQINLTAHGKSFPKKSVLFDPAINLTYAARVLTNEFQWTLSQSQPNWWTAVGRYHAPNKPTLAKRYREIVYQRCVVFSERCAQYGAL